MTSDAFVDTRALQESLKETSEIALKWFEARTTRIQRSQFEMIGGLEDNRKGSVYVYYQDDNALYVGVTGGPVKGRIHFQTSPHKKRRWWKSWTHMRFCQISDQTDRIYLELLLIVAYKPLENKRPMGKDPSNFLLNEIE